MPVKCLITDKITTLEIHKGCSYVTKFLHYPKCKQHDNKHNRCSKLFVQNTPRTYFWLK